MADKHERVTFFAPATMGDYSISPTEVTFGRGDPNNPRGDAYYALDSVPTTSLEHQAILESLDEAAAGQPITRRNASPVLGRAIELAAKKIELTTEATVAADRQKDALADEEDAKTAKYFRDKDERRRLDEERLRTNLSNIPKDQL